MKKHSILILIVVLAFIFNIKIVNGATCSSITDEKQCVSTKERDETCKWINGSKGGKCYRPYPNVNSCAGFTNKIDCQIGKSSISSTSDTYTGSNSFGCAWNEKYGFCSVTGLTYLSCGNGSSKAYDIPEIVPRLTSYLILILKTVTPTILIVVAMIQLVRAVAAQSEDDMKKAKNSLVKKIIIAVLIFVLISIVQFIVKQVADDSETLSVQSCLECFVNNDCKDSAYFTDGYGNCYSVKDNKLIDCPVKDY